MIPIGLKVGFFDGYAKGWPESIQIAPCQEYVWAYINTKSELMGDTKVVLKQLNEALKKSGYTVGAEREAWAEKCAKAHAEGVTAREARAMKYGPDHPRFKDGKFMHLGYMSQIIREVNEELYGSAVRAGIDAYTMSDFVMPYLMFTRPSSCITSNDYAGVGHGLAQAIGAAIADRENGSNIPFLALMGDAGMMNAGLDYHVAVMYKLPIVYMVMNNGGWMPGMKYPWYGPQWENLGEQDQYGKEWMGAMMQGEERPREGTDFTALCKMFGGTGMRCFSEANFKEDLKKAYAIAEKEGPVIMDCIIDQHLVNKAVTGPVYSLFYAHLPWKDLPKRGQHARRTFLTNWFPGLKDMPEMPVYDNWDALEDDQYTYPVKYDMFK
jgi:thiamine pyrophosphate-dependent acetolactate synthase large subunit-like protein